MNLSGNHLQEEKVLRIHPESLMQKKRNVSQNQGDLKMHILKNIARMH